MEKLVLSKDFRLNLNWLDTNSRKCVYYILKIDLHANVVLNKNLQ